MSGGSRHLPVRHHRQHPRPARQLVGGLAFEDADGDAHQEPGRRRADLLLVVLPEEGDDGDRGIQIAQPPRVAGELVSLGFYPVPTPASSSLVGLAIEGSGLAARPLRYVRTVRSVTMNNSDDTPQSDGKSQPAACTCGEPKGAHYDDCALLAARREQRHREYMQTPRKVHEVGAPGWSIADLD